jgi:double-strand break repair protein MRE11
MATIIVGGSGYNLSIAGLPIFSIHGNHDDPSGHGGHSCLDLIHEAGLINYFGKVTDLKQIRVRPILLRKGDVHVALYGLSNVKVGLTAAD